MQLNNLKCPPTYGRNRAVLLSYVSLGRLPLTQNVGYPIIYWQTEESIKGVTIYGIHERPTNSSHHHPQFPCQYLEPRRLKPDHHLNPMNFPSRLLGKQPHQAPFWMMHQLQMNLKRLIWRWSDWKTRICWREPPVQILILQTRRLDI